MCPRTKCLLCLDEPRDLGWRSHSCTGRPQNNGNKCFDGIVPRAWLGASSVVFMRAGGSTELLPLGASEGESTPLRIQWQRETHIDS